MLKIHYTDNTVQIVRPNMSLFNGDWEALAQAVAGDRTYNFEVK